MLPPRIRAQRELSVIDVALVVNVRVDVSRVNEKLEGVHAVFKAETSSVML